MSTSSSSIPPSTATTHPAAATLSNATSSSKTQLYALAARVPLIKSPSISIPKPVQLPPDLHPLPADISAYFVYNFSLESYVLDANTPSSSRVGELLAKHARYLEERQRHKAEQQRELLRRVAPGYSGDVLLPSTSIARMEGGGTGETIATGEARNAKQTEHQQQQQQRTPLDDLADHLAQLDALNTQPGGPSPTSSQPYH